MKPKTWIKRPFQLLELMVAVMILLICIVPAMKIMTTVFLEEREIIRKNERDHIAHLIHASVVELLYKRQIHLPLEEGSLSAIAVEEELIQELLFKFRYRSDAVIKIVKIEGGKKEGKPKKVLAELTITLREDSRKKGLKSQSPTALYRYLIYIDSGDKEKKQVADGDDDDKEGDEESLSDDLDTSASAGLQKDGAVKKTSRGTPST